MNITQAGIGSGLELESIIEAFITAESVPTEIRLQDKEDRTRTELSGVGSFKSALSQFQSVLKKLDTIDEFNQQTVTASDDSISVSTNGFATDGSFDIIVDRLASATRIQTENFAGGAGTTFGVGTLTLASANGDTFDVDIDGADDLSAIRDKINSSTDNFGVQVTLVNLESGTYLSYSSSETGEINELTVTTDDNALDALAQSNTTSMTTNANAVTTSAQDAKIRINGDPTNAAKDDNVVYSSTNEFKNSIEDVTIVVNKVSTLNASDNPVASTLTIAQDTSVASEIINEFVSGYNALTEAMVGLAAPRQGRLAFDSDLRSMRGQLNNIVTSTVSGVTGNVNALSSIGILINRDGKLEISAVGIGTMDSGAKQLSNAIANNLDQVGSLFAADGGVVSQLTSLIETYTDSDGSLSVREKTLNANLEDIEDEWQAHEDFLRSYEETLRSRFAFLDSTIAAYDATSSWLTSALKPKTASE
ncbi:MAG: flagellar filament capping protein FliD [Thalassotalea sp.]